MRQKCNFNARVIGPLNRIEHAAAESMYSGGGGDGHASREAVAWKIGQGCLQ
jgi:hypothetical protein